MTRHVVRSPQEALDFMLTLLPGELVLQSVSTLRLIGTRMEPDWSLS